MRSRRNKQYSAYLHAHTISILKQHAKNQPTPNLRPSPHSPQHHNPHHNSHNTSQNYPKQTMLNLLTTITSSASVSSPKPPQSRPMLQCLHHKHHTASSTSLQLLQTTPTTVSSLDAHHNLLDATGMKDIMSQGTSACSSKHKYLLGLVQ